MKNERIELFIYVNVINKSKATYGLYLKYYDKNNLFVMDKKVSSDVIRYKKIEEVVYNSFIPLSDLVVRNYAATNPSHYSTGLLCALYGCLTHCARFSRRAFR